MFIPHSPLTFNFPNKILHRRAVGNQFVLIVRTENDDVIGRIFKNGKILRSSLSGIFPKKVSVQEVSIMQSYMQDCMFHISGMTIRIFPKLKGGLPPINGQPLTGQLPSMEKLQKDLSIGMDLAILGLNVTPLLALASNAHPYIFVGTTIFSAFLSFLKSRVDASEFSKYKQEVDRIESQTISDQKKIERMDSFLQLHLSKDLSKIPGLENDIANEISAIAKTKNVDVLKNFIEVASVVYRYKSPEAAARLRTYGLVLCEGINAINKLKEAPNSPKWIEQALGSARSVIGLLGLDSSPLGSPEMSAILELHKAFKDQSMETKSHLKAIEVIMGSIWAGLTTKLDNIKNDIQELKNFSDNQFFSLDQRLSQISTQIDRKSNQSLQMKLDSILGEIKYAQSQGPMDNSDYKRLVRQIWTWAIDLSGKPYMVGSGLNNLDDINFSIGTLSSIYGFNGSVHHPLVWGLAADGYMDLRTKINPSQPILQLSNQTAEFRAMIDAGENTCRFIEQLQRDKGFFQGLISKYKKVLTDIKNQGMDAQLSKELDDRYFELRQFIQLGFSRSWIHDFFLISLFTPQVLYPHRILNANELKMQLQTNSETDEFWEHLFESIDLLNKRIEAKIDSHSRGETDDQPLLLTFTLYKLSRFAKSHFPNALPNAKRRVFKTEPCHTPNLDSLCKGNLFLAVKLGVLSEVEDLLDANNTTIDMVNPLTGKTALHYAAKYGRRDIVKVLIDRNARADIADKFGKLPIDEAKNLQNPTIQKQIMDLLEKKIPLSVLGSQKFFSPLPQKNDLLTNGGVRIINIKNLDRAIKEENLRFPKVPSTVYTLVAKSGPGQMGSISTIDLTTGKTFQTFSKNGGIIGIIPQPNCTLQNPNFEIITMRIDGRSTPKGSQRTGGALEIWEWRGAQQSKKHSMRLGAQLVTAKVEGDYILITYKQQIEAIDRLTLKKSVFPALTLSGIAHLRMPYPVLIGKKLIAPTKIYPKATDLSVWDIEKGTTPLFQIKNVCHLLKESDLSSFYIADKIAFFDGSDPTKIRMYNLKDGKDISTFNLPGNPKKLLLKDMCVIASWENRSTRTGEVESQGISFYQAYTGTLLQTIPEASTDFTIIDEKIIFSLNEKPTIWELK